MSVGLVLALAALAALAAVPGAQRDSPADLPPLLIQGAMTIEVHHLASKLADAAPQQIGDWMFWRGTIDGYPVVVSKTLKGVANAAAATAIAIERFHPAVVINQGTAGGHDPALRIADIVIGRTAVSLGAFRSGFRAAGRGSNPLEWRPLDLTAADGSAANDPNARRVAKFDADPQLLALARQVGERLRGARVVEGVIGTSDMWNDELDLIARYRNDFGTSVEEMETASAAQIAKQLNVPFLGVRVVSDNITNGGVYDPKTSEACEEFVYQLVKARIASKP